MIAHSLLLVHTYNVAGVVGHAGQRLMKLLDAENIADVVLRIVAIRGQQGGARYIPPLRGRDGAVRRR